MVEVLICYVRLLSITLNISVVLVTNLWILSNALETRRIRNVVTIRLKGEKKSWILSWNLFESLFLEVVFYQWIFMQIVFFLWAVKGKGTLNLFRRDDASLTFYMLLNLYATNERKNSLIFKCWWPSVRITRAEPPVKNPNLRKLRYRIFIFANRKVYVIVTYVLNAKLSETMAIVPYLEWCRLDQEKSSVILG